jgi:hypothetical protein
MGESTIRGNVSHGDGVYRSTDAGKTWSHLGLEATRNIAKLRVDPRDPDVAFVAAFGHAHGPNAERGVYRTTDGGKSWELVLHRSEDAGACDLSIDPFNPRVIYAALWEARRGPHYMSSGGEGSGLFRSTDGGDTWTELTRNQGMPETGLIGKIGVSVSAAQRDRVYAIVEHAEQGGIHRSDDGGETWVKLSDDRRLRQRAWYYSHITADPGDADSVWVLNVEQFKSIDAGKSFEPVPAPARRQPRPLDRPDQPGPDGPRQRRRRDDLDQRRPLVDAAVQPADLGALPRRDRRPAALPRLRLAAGQHLDLAPEPVQLRGDHPDRVARGRRRRGRLHPGPAGQPEHRLRRRVPGHHDPLRPRHPARQEHLGLAG